MDTLTAAMVLVLLTVIAFSVIAPKAQPPQIIYVRAEPREPKREEGAGCLPLVVFVLVVIMAIGLL
jgi:hypothetical protein